MKSNAKSDGLSARRNTIPFTLLQNVRLKWAAGILMLSGILLASCQGKINEEKHSDSPNARAALKDSTLNPKVNIKVNRRFDDKGNLVGFDSLYSSYYATSSRDTLHMDSLMSGFNNYFHRDHSRFFNNRLNTLFFNDSLLYPDFFHQDFFMKHYQMNDAFMRGMMNQMDSIKNQYYKDRNTGDDQNSKSRSRS
jgi:hypothetical protein